MTCRIHKVLQGMIGYFNLRFYIVTLDCVDVKNKTGECMPSPVTSSNSWMPSHYTSLSDACLTHAGSEHVTPMSWGMSIKQGPQAYVEHLSSAASKYRLASLCNGLKGPDPEAIG